MIKANSDAAFRDLIDAFMRFYREKLFNPHWGESVSFRADNALLLSMAFQGLDQPQAEAAWKPFLEFVAASPDNIWWSDTQIEVDIFIYGYESMWLPVTLLGQPDRLADTLFASTRHFEVQLHFNKGLGGRPKTRSPRLARPP